MVHLGEVLVPIVDNQSFFTGDLSGDFIGPGFPNTEGGRRSTYDIGLQNG